MILIFLLFIQISQLIFAEDKPKWFQPDSKTASGWEFSCSQSGKTDEESLSGARAQCSQKICMLFGIEVTSEVKSVETLKDSGVTNTVIEKCPNVRVVGRVEKNKLVDCGDDICTAFVRQFYPKEEYDKEFERLNRPVIVKEFEKTIIIREGSKTYKDPKECRQSLKAYTDIRGELEVSQKLRITQLALAEKSCLDIDDRDISLQTELRGYLTGALSTRPTSYATYLTRAIAKNGALDQIIKRFKTIEMENLEADALKPKIKKIVESNYDFLFFRDSYIPGQGFILLSGKIVIENPNVTEQKNCQKHFETLLHWPQTFHSEINVCVPTVSGQKICNIASEFRIRMSYLNCICTIGSKSPAQCIQNLNQFIVDNCENHSDKTCFQKLGKFASESMLLSNIPSQLK